ncbi:hypothetical protein ND446_02555 [Yersinia ruckeri]|nr:hypothetical protein [Yersinia ruckeri]UZX56883.1 hypothetical protein ND446_02555 [Yersinia ruckeri]
MSGCSTTAPLPPSVPYQANLLTPCNKVLPRLGGNTGNDFDNALRAYRSLYTLCAARHNKLINEINTRQGNK